MTLSHRRLRTILVQDDCANAAGLVSVCTMRDSSTRLMAFASVVSAFSVQSALMLMVRRSSRSSFVGRLRAGVASIANVGRRAQILGSLASIGYWLYNTATDWFWRSFLVTISERSTSRRVRRVRA